MLDLRNNSSLLRLHESTVYHWNAVPGIKITLRTFPVRNRAMHLYLKCLSVLSQFHILFAGHVLGPVIPTVYGTAGRTDV